MGEADVNAKAFAYLRPGDRIRLVEPWCGVYGQGIVCEVVRRVRDKWRLRVLYPSAGTRPRRPFTHAVTPLAWEHLTHTVYALHHV